MFVCLNSLIAYECIEVYFASNDLSFSDVHIFLATLHVKGKKTDRKKITKNRKKLNKKTNKKQVIK